MCAVGAPTWAAFTGAVKPEWNNPDFDTLAQRAKQIDRVYGLLAETFATRTTAEWLQILKEANVPAIQANDFVGRKTVRDGGAAAHACIAAMRETLKLVAAEVQKADATRIGALTAMFERFGRSSLSAGVRARAIYLVQIGYISMQTQEDLALRMSRMAEYVEVYTGRVAEPRELARFFSRHGFTTQEVVAPDTAPAG